MLKDDLKNAQRIFSGRFAEIAKAWMSGKTIQYRTSAAVAWRTVNENDSIEFIDKYEYQVKPEPRKLKVAIYLNKYGKVVVNSENCLSFPDQFQDNKRISDIVELTEKL